MRKFSVFLLCIITLLIFAFLHGHKTVETITYFPIDEQLSFTMAETFIDTCPDKTSKVCWKIESDTSYPFYLRQDLAILFVNGKFQAVLTKWEQNKNKLILEKELNLSPNSYLQAISYHHGEIHHKDATITSVQRMSAKNTFLLKTKSEEMLLRDQYRKASKDIQKKLLVDTEDTLHAVWDRWINDQGIILENYEVISLVALEKYNKQPLLTFTQAETDKIIGQLWEGLYKSYLIPLLDSSHDGQNTHMPIILISHDKTHLIVLYEKNNEIMSLYQKIIQSSDEPTITIGSNQANK